MTIDRLWPKYLPYIKRKYIYALFAIFAILCIILSFWPYTSNGIFNNATTYYSPLGFEINQFTVFGAFFVGILAFIASIYNTNENYKAMKLSSIPEKSLNLMIDLEFLFNEYEIKSKIGEEDEITLLVEILKYWKNHQKAFKLLTPKFYKEFIEFISYPEIINKNDKPYEKNAKYAINAILTHITNIALENENEDFYFIKPQYIKDDSDMKLIGDCELFYSKFEFDKQALYEYIGKLEGQKTKKYCEKQFKRINGNLKKLLTNLKKELEEY